MNTPHYSNMESINPKKFIHIFPNNIVINNTNPQISNTDINNYSIFMVDNLLTPCECDAILERITK